MSLDVAGGPRDGDVVWRSSGAYGDPLGESMDPPLALEGVAGLGITCEFQNASDRHVGYGLGDQEMCVVLIYADGKKAAGSSVTNVSVTDEDDIHRTDGLCLAFGL